MLRTLKALFEDGISRIASAETRIDELPLAVAALLLEVARADHEVDAAEKRAVVNAVAQVCGLESARLDTLLATASDAVEESVSLYEFTQVINERFEQAQKRELLELLWRVARADGRVDHYEEYYIRKLADLLYLSHGDFIRTKLASEKD